MARSPALKPLRPFGVGRPGSSTLPTALLALGVAALTALLAGTEYLLHLNLSTALSLQFMLVVLAALRLGFLQATSVAVAAVVCLDFFFIPPIFSFSVQRSANWVSLASFEGAALVVSRLSSQMRHNAALGELQRRRTAKLYELSRAILLIDSRQSTSEQLSALICELMQVEQVAFWIAHDAAEPGSSQGPDEQAPILGRDSAYAAYQAGRNDDDRQLRTSRRVLRSGTTAIGAIVLSGWETDPLLADAVASLAAVALERARAIEKENRAEVARNAEQLRTAVLDGLAHGFKTPLTAIQTASSGLLAIGQLTETQAELVSIIDEEATMLTQLTTRLLQTAALEAKEVRLRRAMHSMPALIDAVLAAQEPRTRARFLVEVEAGLQSVSVDAPLLALALAQLVDNAARYSAVGSTIRIVVSQQAMETQVAVLNTGSSIPKEEQERIFERYYRGADAVRGPSGTGLGLSIVRKTAEAHGGRAWVRCTAGTTGFYMTVAGPRKGNA